ncbi:RICIN domain-containing protein [Streptomyces sp. NPDC001401]|uniref:RICIN domain-containing protein n=1 Tax=Streptomyces sp. NPDC001401 TaxID=3364570 RepID=UPI00368AFC8C
MAPRAWGTGAGHRDSPPPSPTRCEPTSGGYLIRNFENRQILEVSNGSTANGAAVDQWMPLNQSNQAWTIQ